MSFICVVCKQSWDAKPKKWLSRISQCSVCYERNRVRKKRGAQPPPTARYMARWSKQDDAQLRMLIGTATLSEAAAALKRTPKAVAARANRVFPGRSFFQEARKKEGMSVSDVAIELGTGTGTVVSWIRDGILRARRVSPIARGVYTIDPDDVTAFLRDRGWRLSTLAPNPVWREVIDEIRIELSALYVSRKELTQVLILDQAVIGRWMSRYAFPRPIPGQSPHYGHQWFRRDEVRLWFASHPQYWTKAAVVAGFVDEDRFSKDHLCIVPGCAAKRHALGYCANHRRQYQKRPADFVDVAAPVARKNMKRAATFDEKEYMRQWRERNRERLREHERQRRLADPDSYRAAQRARYHRKKAVQQSIVNKEEAL